MLIETASEKQSKRLFGLLNCSDQEIIDELKKDSVTEIHRIKSRKNGELQDSGSLILTFDKLTIPKKIKVALYVLNVR